MAGKCKVCHSPFREQIEARLLKGESVTSLAEWLKTQNVSIAHPSIQRHRDNHLAATMKENGFLSIDTPQNKENAATVNFEPFIDELSALKRINDELAETDVFESVVKERKFTQLLLEKIVQKQLVIVHELQAQYIEGKAGYQDSQIRGLKTILDMANTLPTYKNDKLLREIHADSERQYVVKISEHAKNTALELSEKYSLWYRLREKPYYAPPNEMIKDAAIKLHPISEFSRNEWREKMREMWIREFGTHTPEQYDFEIDILRTIEHFTDNLRINSDLSSEKIDKLEKQIILKIIENYETPELANDDDEGLNDLISNVINSRL